MITRFAPSPTGALHLGHAYSALTVWSVAEQFEGTALLRIEDTDSTRVRPEHEHAIYDDLKWLGLDWPTPVRRQSAHMADYTQTLLRLAVEGLIYPCSCTRRQIKDAGAQPGADGLVYPGTCRGRSMADAQPMDALRLDVTKAMAQISGNLSCIEISDGVAVNVITTADEIIAGIGDPVLQRKDTGDAAYHLACVHDDALQKITHVVRGQDLQMLTPLHVLLQRLLGYPTPIYYHHGLVTDDDGKRLAKIDQSKAIAKYRAEGASVDDLKAMIGWVD